MKPNQCSKCGTELPMGSLKYIVGVNIFADFDGYLSDDLGEVDFDKILAQIEAMDPNELEDDVHQEMTLILCKNCKDIFTNEILNLGNKISDSTRIPIKPC